MPTSRIINGEPSGVMPCQSAPYGIEGRGHILQRNDGFDLSIRRVNPLQGWNGLFGMFKIDVLGIARAIWILQYVAME